MAIQDVVQFLVAAGAQVMRYADNDLDGYDRATQLAGVTQNLDGHDHAYGWGKGVRRLNTATAPRTGSASYSGEVQLDTATGTLKFSDGTNVRTISGSGGGDPASIAFFSLGV